MTKILQQGLETLANCSLQNAEHRKEFTNRDLFNATIILSDVLFNKVFDLIETENIDLDTASAMAEQCGSEIRKVIKKYTNIDLHDVAKEL